MITDAGNHLHTSDFTKATFRELLPLMAKTGSEICIRAQSLESEL